MPTCTYKKQGGGKGEKREREGSCEEYHRTIDEYIVMTSQGGKSYKEKGEKSKKSDESYGSQGEHFKKRGKSQKKGTNTNVVLAVKGEKSKKKTK